MKQVEAFRLRSDRCRLNNKWNSEERLCCVCDVVVLQDLTMDNASYYGLPSFGWSQSRRRQTNLKCIMYFFQNVDHVVSCHLTRSFPTQSVLCQLCPPLPLRAICSLLSPLRGAWDPRQTSKGKPIGICPVEHIITCITNTLMRILNQHFSVCLSWDSAFTTYGVLTKNTLIFGAGFWRDKTDLDELLSHLLTIKIKI